MLRKMKKSAFGIRKKGFGTVRLIILGGKHFVRWKINSTSVDTLSCKYRCVYMVRIFRRVRASKKERLGRMFERDLTGINSSQLLFVPSCALFSVLFTQARPQAARTNPHAFYSQDPNFRRFSFFLAWKKLRNTRRGQVFFVFNESSVNIRKKH